MHLFCYTDWRKSHMEANNNNPEHKHLLLKNNNGLTKLTKLYLVIHTHNYQFIHENRKRNFKNGKEE